MMIRQTLQKTHILGILFLLFFSFSCSQKGDIEVIDHNFDDLIEQRQNLVFKFNKSLTTNELLNQWSDEVYIKIEPEVAGKFKWTSLDELTFSPEVGFAPSTDYTFTLTDKIYQNSKELKGFAGESKFEAHTPYLTLLGAEAFWVLGDAEKPEVQMNLNFNYDVNPADLEKLVSLKIGDYEIGFVMNSGEAGRSIKFILTSEDAKKLASKELKIKIGNGLGLKSGDFKADGMNVTTNIPAIEDFQISDARSQQSDDDAYIKITTNQAVRTPLKSLSNFISISPNVNFKVEMADFGFLVKGDFAIGTNYKLSIKKGLQGVFGEGLKEGFESYIIFGKVKPKIEFAESKAVYLTSEGEKNVGVKIMGVDNVHLEVYKIYKNNLLHFFENTVGAYNYDDMNDYSYSNYNKYGDVIYEEVLTAKSFDKNGDLNIINMDAIQKQDNRPFKGLYLVRVSSEDDRWVHDGQLVSVSDLGFIVKHTKDEVLVFVNSIKTAQPVSDVEVTLVSSNNQEVLKLKTDGKGVAHFKDLETTAPKFKIQMITASKGEEFNFMHFGHNRLETYKYNVSGISPNSSGYRAFVYGQRSLYRPGEKMYFKTIVRDADWQKVANIPIRMRVTLPNGKELVSKRATLNEEGTFEMDIQLNANAVTGSYTAEVYSSNDILLGSKNINVEEFVPQRIKVNAELNKKQVQNGDSIVINGQAFNLFGPPATNRKYEISMTIERSNFETTDKKLDDYVFYMQGNRGTSYYNTVERIGLTNQEGKIKQSFTIPRDYSNIGLLKGRIYTTVFDETDRPVSRNTSFDIHTQEIYFGFKPLDRYWVGTNTAVRLPIVAINTEGKVATGKAIIKVLRFEWQTVVEKNYYGDYQYVSRKKTIVEKEETVNVSGLATAVNFIPKRAGQYEVRISLPSDKGYSKNYVSESFYAYSYGSSMNTSFKVDKEGEIKITLDRDEYEVGESAKLLFRTPFEGKLLITIEKDNVVDYKVVETDKYAASLELELEDKHLPNIFVGATLIKPLDNGELPLTVAYGYQNIKVNNSEKHKIDLTIEAATKSRSRKTQEILVKSNKPNSEITVSVVDEGILQIKGEATPKPYLYFFQNRALGVSSANMYPRLFPDLKVKQRSYGSGGYDLDKRTNPLDNQRVKPVAFWSGTLKTDGNGEAKYTINIPQFSGSLRVMAVAVNDVAFGSAETNITVADPIVISAGFPRFLSPNDEITVPVTVTNTTGKMLAAKTKMEVTGVMQATGDDSQKLTLDANSEDMATFTLKADQAIGTAKAKIKVEALGEEFLHEVDITIRPSTSLLKESGAGMVKGGSSKTLDLTNDFVASSADAKLVISKSPMVQFAKDLSYLVGYPHGCVEQTTSKAFPQLYLADISESLGDVLPKYANPNENVRAAVAKLQSMQLYHGGLSYWQGGTYENLWGTVYATHFLMEAKKAGFDVSQDVLNKIYGHLRQEVKKKRTRDYYYYNGVNGNTRVVRKIAPREMIYALYVLALAGEQEVSSMNYYKSNLSILSEDSKYMLALTYKLLGDNASYRTMLPASFGTERSATAFGESFYSYIRDRAIALNMLIDHDPNSSQIGTLSKHLSEQMRNKRYLNTQERAFAMLAMGKLSRKANQSTVTASVSVNGKNAGNFSDKTLSIHNADLSGEKVKIETKGEGNLYYFWETEGLSASGAYVEEDNYLKVRKAFFDRNGNAISGNTFKQNDLIVVRLEVSSTEPNVKNVVLTDMLPAGFEIENQRLGATQGTSWIKNKAYSQHTDFRDDRVNFYLTASKNEQYYYYVVRAVTKGKFRMGPASADAMYNGEYHSYHGAGEVIVE
jgi:uncharacterized protein YfaS (alpha-2-macroglobulin family)